MPTFSSPTIEAAKAAKPLRRIDASSGAFSVIAIAAVGLTFLAFFLASSFSLMWCARQIGLPAWAGWTLPAGLDASLLAQGMARMAVAAKGGSTRLNTALLAAFTAASAGANAWHSLSMPGVTGVALWAHLGWAILIPCSIMATAEALFAIAIAEPADRETARALARLADRGQLRSQGQPIGTLAGVGTATRRDQEAQLRDRWAAAQAEGRPSLSRVAKEAGVSVSALKAALAAGGSSERNGAAGKAEPAKRSVAVAPRTAPVLELGDL